MLSDEFKRELLEALDSNVDSKLFNAISALGSKLDARGIRNDDQLYSITAYVGKEISKERPEFAELFGNPNTWFKHCLVVMNFIGYRRSIQELGGGHESSVTLGKNFVRLVQESNLPGENWWEHLCPLAKCYLRLIPEDQKPWL